MRTAIYARFSTELQQERSIEDQFVLCRAYAAKNGLDVVAVYDDRARSGASIFGRDGLMRMMDAARDGPSTSSSSRRWIAPRAIRKTSPGSGSA